MIPSGEAGAILRALGRRGDSPSMIACSLFRAVDSAPSIMAALIHEAA
jgi:hypothetical protein